MSEIMKIKLYSALLFLVSHFTSQFSTKLMKIKFSKSILSLPDPTGWTYHAPVGG
jgi:hypothetical protein